MDGTTTYVVEATTTSVVECFGVGGFLTLAPFVRLDSLNKGGIYGKGVKSIEHIGVGLYKIHLADPYAIFLWGDMRVDTSNGIGSFVAQPDVFDAVNAGPGTGSVSQPPTDPTLIFSVYNIATGALADPGDDAFFVVRICFRNRQQSS